MCKDDDPRFSRTINQALHYFLGQLVFEAVGVSSFLLSAGFLGGAAAVVAVIGCSILICECNKDKVFCFKLIRITNVIAMVVELVHMIVFFVVLSDDTLREENEKKFPISYGVRVMIVVIGVILFIAQEAVRGGGIVLANKAIASLEGGDPTGRLDKSGGSSQAPFVESGAVADL